MPSTQPYQMTMRERAALLVFFFAAGIYVFVAGGLAFYVLTLLSGRAPT